MLATNEARPMAVLDSTPNLPRPIVNPFAAKSFENVFTPAMVCASVEINPGFVASAGDNVNEVPEIVPPAA